MAYNPSITPFGFDASSRTRVSQTTTQLDGKILGSDDTFLFENNGTGTATYANNKVNLSVTSGQFIIRQTKRYANYFSGKSQLVECTFDNFQTQTNVTKRIGYFSSNTVSPFNSTLDGFFVEDDGTTKTLQIWRAGTQTASIAFTAMDNAAAITSQNWSNFNVIAFDFLWLGGAVLRFFVKTANGFELIHTVNYAGTATDTFTLSPNQPLRYEVRSTTGVGSLRYICSQVASEGSINEFGKGLSIFNTTAIATNVVGTIYAIKSFRKQTAFRDTCSRVMQCSIIVSSANDTGILMLILNPTLSAAITYTNNSKIQEGTPTNQTITAGTGRVLFTSAITSASPSSGILSDNQYNEPGITLANVQDQLVLAYMPTTANQTVNGILILEEY